MHYLRPDISYTPLTHQDFSDGVGDWAHDSDQRQWDQLGWYERQAEAEAADADEIERQSSGQPGSSLSIDLADTRALLVLDQARAVLACLQSDEDTVGTLTITATPYTDGSIEYSITVRP
jgi:hypothetical protein